MDQRQIIRIGLVGAGYWGSKLAKEYLSIEETLGIASLDYVCDAAQSILQGLSRDLNRPKLKFTTNYKQVLEDKDLDAVHIAVPNEFHYELARVALESGKNVLIEKPMATTSREAFKLARLAEETGCLLQVGHIFRFNNALRLVKDILKQGRMGRVYYSSLNWAAYMEPPKNRDIVFDLAPHPVDVLNYLLDEWPIGVDAIGESFVRGRSGEEEIAFINLEFPDSVLANIYISWIQQGAKERRVKVVCEKGMIDCDALNQTVVVYENESEDKRRNGSANVVGGNSLEVVPNNTIRSMQLHFIERIRGRGPQFNSALIGAQTVQVLESISQTMRARRNFQLLRLSPSASPLLISESAMKAGMSNIDNQ